VILLGAVVSDTTLQTSDETVMPRRREARFRLQAVLRGEVKEALGQEITLHYTAPGSWVDPETGIKMGESLSTIARFAPSRRYALLLTQDATTGDLVFAEELGGAWEMALLLDREGIAALSEAFQKVEGSGFKVEPNWREILKGLSEEPPQR
jgi:hypothetical protein